jgi:spectinomycin phosphotransferase
MITASGPVLVDWDTVRVAPPTRDLWMMGSIDTYASLTGRDVPVEQLEFYRLRWDLKDLCGSARWFTGPHERTTDTELAWQGSITICHRLATAGFSSGRTARACGPAWRADQENHNADQQHPGGK